jgi:hypothetical protein
VHSSHPVLLRLLQLGVPGCVLLCELPYKQHMAGGCATQGGPPSLPTLLTGAPAAEAAAGGLVEFSRADAWVHVQAHAQAPAGFLTPGVSPPCLHACGLFPCGSSAPPPPEATWPGAARVPGLPLSLSCAPPPDCTCTLTQHLRVWTPTTPALHVAVVTPCARIRSCIARCF